MPTGSPSWTPAELDYVRLPALIAELNGVEPCGTIVSLWLGDTKATVECTIIGGRPGWDSRLVDLPLQDLSPGDSEPG